MKIRLSYKDEMYNHRLARGVMMAKLTQTGLLRQFIKDNIQDGCAGKCEVINDQFLYEGTPIVERVENKKSKYVLNITTYSSAVGRVKKQVVKMVPDSEMMEVFAVPKNYSGSLLKCEPLITSFCYGGWWWFVNSKQKLLDSKKVGKWMHFFNSVEFADDICWKAINEEIVYECKYTDASKGVICFYIEGNDIEAHKRVIKFFLENELVRKTKTGRLYNIAFKYDFQTLNNEYDDDFKAEINLNNFIDLDTGEWKV